MKLWPTRLPQPDALLAPHNPESTQSKGILIMILGALFLPIMDTVAKLMGDSVSSGFIVLCRFGFQTLFLLPLVIPQLSLPTLAEFWLHLRRASAICFATMCFFTAIQVMPIADALAIFFVEPLLITLLAPWIIGETVGWRRILAASVGLVGTIIIIGPSASLFGIYSFLPLGTAVGFAFYFMYTRQLAQSVPALSMQFYSGLLGTVIVFSLLIVLQPFEWSVFEISQPTRQQWFLLMTVGLLSAIGHMILTISFKYAEASVLAPFQYAELISAVILGWLVFGDIPTINTWIGGAILVGSGLYIFRRERVIALNESSN